MREWKLSTYRFLHCKLELQMVVAVLVDEGGGKLGIDEEYCGRKRNVEALHHIMVTIEFTGPDAHLHELALISNDVDIQVPWLLGRAQDP